MEERFSPPSILIRKHAKVKVKELVSNSCIFEIHCCYYHHLCCHYCQQFAIWFWSCVFSIFCCCWKFGILHPGLAEEEELRKIGAFDGRRMSEYAQCCSPSQETRDILFYKNSINWYFRDHAAGIVFISQNNKIFPDLKYGENIWRNSQFCQLGRIGKHWVGSHVHCTSKWFLPICLFIFAWNKFWFWFQPILKSSL